MTWNEARVEVLKELHNDGWTSSQIAARLGVTRCAVCGKIARLGLTRAKPAPRTASRARRAPRHKQTTPMPASQRGRDHRGHLEALPLPSPAETDIPRVSLLDASDRACRWPCAGVEAIAAGLPYYCGIKKVPGLPYCEAHSRRAFATPPALLQNVEVVPAREMETTT